MQAQSFATYLQERDRTLAETVRAAAVRIPLFHTRLIAAGIDASAVRGSADLDRLPIISKDQLLEAQRAAPPFGGLVAADAELTRLFCSPGPLYEPQPPGKDPWRWQAALRALGIGQGHRVLNCFSYHLSPAGAMLDEACQAIGATVVPAGTGNLELTVQVAADLQLDTYVGLPSYLRALIEKAAERELTWPIQRALVTGEPLPRSLRVWLEEHVRRVLQSYGTAEAGLLGYETAPDSGLEIPGGVLVQVCDLDTGAARYDDGIGEVVVSLLRSDIALIRFGTGDLSAWHPSPDGSPRLRGVLGRVGEAIKVRGLFLHPRQAAAALADLPEVASHRFVVRREQHRDRLICELVPARAEDAAHPGALAAQVGERIRSWLRLSAEVRCVPELPPGPGLIDERDWS
jgi:phenylacetate-CoA ligase